MKKLLTLGIALAAISSQALSFTWSANARVQFGANNFITDGSAVGYLVYLGDSSALTITGISVSEATAATQASSSTGLANKRGTISATYDALAGSEIGNGGTYGAGSTFGMFIKYTSDGVDWYNFSSTTYTIPAGSTDITTGLAQTFAFDFDSKTEISSSQNASAGGGWYAAVPEPSTAALALAGLALLIRRRKA